MYLLDTNICIAIIKANPIVMAQFEQKSLYCYISTVVLAELKKGAYCSQRVERNLGAIADFLTLLLVEDFDELAADEFGKIQGELRRMGRPTGEVDAQIAAVARSRGDILVTNNTRHFRNVLSLQLEDWLISD